MASTSDSFHDADGTAPCTDESMLPMDMADDNTREDEPMMPVDSSEEDQIDDNVVALREDEPVLQVDESADAAAVCLPDLPIHNILVRVPPSSATRFKAVCKNWHSMITDYSYARDHRAAPPVRSVLLHDGEAPFPVAVVDESAGAARLSLRPWRGRRRHGHDVQNCCGALACLRSRCRSGAVLLNPATGESLDLGYFFRRGDRSTWTLAEHLPWYCLGRCAAGNGEYKVVRLDVRLPFSSPPHVTCEVLALGRESWDSSGRFVPKWKEVGIWNVGYCPADRGVHVAGVVYYLAWCVAGRTMVISFDLSTHKVGQMDLPAAAAADEDGDCAVASSLSELDGRLCLSLVLSGEEARTAMDVYVLGDDTDGDGKAWFQVCRINLDVTARRVPRPLLRRGSRMLMKRADGSLCYHDMDGVSGEGAAAGEEVVYEHKGCRREKQQLSGVTADVFVESPLPLQAILRGPRYKRERRLR